MAQVANVWQLCRKLKRTLWNALLYARVGMFETARRQGLRNSGGVYNTAMVSNCRILPAQSLGQADTARKAGSNLNPQVWHLTLQALQNEDLGFGVGSFRVQGEQ